jgi:hypothetical protein
MWVAASHVQGVQTEQEKKKEKDCPEPKFLFSLLLSAMMGCILVKPLAQINLSSFSFLSGILVTVMRAIHPSCSFPF